MNTDFLESRVFITTLSKHTYHQIFKFVQAKNDGSIYVTFIPDFKGKYSFHGTGQARYREHDKPDETLLVLPGNQLLNLKKNELGLRHLFTVQLMEPFFQPTSDFGK